MAERRIAEERGQRRTPTDASVGAPGSTGAYKTSDPLGAPGSTGAGQTNRDPTAVPAPAAAVYEVSDFDYGGGQQQQHRHPTSGQEKLGDPLSGSGGQQHHHLNPTAGVGYGGGGQQQELRDPASGTGYGGQQQQLRDPTSGIGYGGRSQQQELRDPLSGVGFTDGGKFEPSQGDQGSTGFTRITTATAPVQGGGVVYGRETETTTAGDLGAAGTAMATGREEKGGMAEKAKEVKDKIKGAVGGHHSR